jgi:hypothetical protein
MHAGKSPMSPQALFEIERAQAAAWAELLMEDMSPAQIAGKLERFELICFQRGWAYPALDPCRPLPSSLPTPGV